ncbi:uncharacterized protein LOC135210969 isoform X2 [Macrobrachium nipponense]|uniref:uncharacterized protein LOC135210969 isoform X2 n=1 Tax=Macrobrachium nipponense TaxID=159736 RepID=UPI0030C7F95D
MGGSYHGVRKELSEIVAESITARSLPKEQAEKLRKQFQEMAKFNGMTTVEFAKHIATCSTSDNLVLLRQFHTSCQSQLSPLFESLEQCLQGDRKSCKTGFPCSLTKEQPTRNNSVALKNDSTLESIMGTKMLENTDDLYEMCNININESESFSHLGTGYSENSTLLVCGSLPSKTVISETESDSNSIEDADFTHNRDRKPLDSSSTVPVNFEEMSVESPSLSSVASNVFDAIIRRDTNPTGITGDHGRVHGKDNSSSVSCSVNGVNLVENNSSSKDFNIFLDNLLFGKSEKNVTKTSQNSDIRREDKKVSPQIQEVYDDGVPGYSKQSKNIKKSSSLRNSLEKKYTSIQEQCSSSYNKVLDQLLFGYASSSLESNNDQVVDVSKSVDCILPSTSRQPGKVSATLGDSLLKDNCEVAGKLNGTTHTNAQKTDVSLKVKDKSLMSDGVEKKILPSSLELQLSLWDSLDKTCEH